MCNRLGVLVGAYALTLVSLMACTSPLGENNSTETDAAGLRKHRNQDAGAPGSADTGTETSGDGSTTCGSCVSPETCGGGGIPNVCGSSVPPPATSSGAVYPPDTTLTFVSEPTVSRPNYLQAITDPTFGTKILRISDHPGMGLSLSNYPLIRHYYAKQAAWNSDDSLVVLSYLNPSPLLDGRTFKFLRTVNLPYRPVLSNVNPNKVYGTRAGSTQQKTQLVACALSDCDMGAGRYTLLHDFSNQYDDISLGDGEGNLSNDDHYMPVLAKKGTGIYLLVYDVQSNSVVATHDLGGSSPDWAGLSPSGNYVVVEWVEYGTTRNHGVELFDRNLNFVRQLYKNSYHGDVASDANGNDLFVMQGDRPSVLIGIQLSNGVVRSLISDAVGQGARHISCRNTKRPGGCYTSDYSSSSNLSGYDEVFAFKLDGSQVVERFAHLHHTNGAPYEAQPQAVPSRDGSRVMFASDWPDPNAPNAPVYAYVAMMAP